jgi:hypothetical protein
MKTFTLFTLLLSLALPAFAQQVTLVTNLSTDIQETSGLVIIDGRIVTHNDSGDDPALYEIDSNTGSVSRTVTITNASHVDWEDIAADDTYIYIGDFGNNSGARTDLKIYRVPVSGYLDESNEVAAEVISFSYPDQTDFTAGSNETNFDAEALISFGDKLYIFTKRWLDEQSTVYELPKEPGTYEAVNKGTFDSRGLVTGASYNPETNVVLLTSYSFIFPYVIKIKDFSGSDFAGGTIDNFSLSLPSGVSVQVESVTTLSANEYYISAESSVLGNPALCKVTFDVTSTEDYSPENAPAMIFPNPASHHFQILHDNFHKAEIYNETGKLILSVKTNPISTKDMEPGIYIVVVRDEERSVIGKARVVVE